MKIRKFPLVLCSLAALSGLFPLQAEIVTVDYQKIFEEYRELRLQDQKLREEVAAFQQTQQAKIQELQAKQQTFAELRNSAAQPDVTDEQRKGLIENATKQLEELNNREQELRQERAVFQQEIEAKAARLRKSIVDKVNERIGEMAKEKGWEMVIDSSAKSATGLKAVIYSADTVDKTNMLITELNATAAPVPAAETEEE